MKKLILILCLLAGARIFCACTNNITDKMEIINVFNKNVGILTEAIRSNDFDQTKKIPGIQSVYVSDDYTDFMCGGTGMGPSTHYYGFFYSEDDDLTAWNGGACPKDELVKAGNGFLWEEKSGDNKYYVEKIGTHFFYYEAHF